MQAKGLVFKYGDNVDTDVIIPARYLNSSDPAELATHCMEDIDKDFVKNVKKGDIIVAEKKLRMRFFQRACAHCHQSGRRKLRYRRDLRQNFLPQCHQHRTSHYRVPGGGKGD